MRRYSVLFVAAVIGTAPVVADPPADYYDDVDTTDSITLRATLHEVIDDHTRFPYTSGNTDTWDILNLADEDPNDPDRIIDVYRNSSLDKMEGGVGPYNREHTWPNSYGFPDDNSSNYPYTDCHMLFLSDASYNTARSNKPYRYCDDACDEYVTVFNDGRGGGSGVYPGNSSWTEGSFTQGTWETWTGRRGDVARAILYMDIRYEAGVHNVTGIDEPDLVATDSESLIDQSNTGDNEDVAYMGMLTDLISWHREDPVDDRERSRNDVVFDHQGNRNPFIDHPEWVDCLYENNCEVVDPDILVVGSCPGPVDIEISDVTAGADVGLVWSFNTGITVLGGGGTCNGTQLDLDAAQLLTVVSADGNGDVTISATAPSSACGAFVQALDLSSCQTTEVAPIP